MCPWVRKMPVGSVPGRGPKLVEGKQLGRHIGRGFKQKFLPGLFVHHAQRHYFLPRALPQLHGPKLLGGADLGVARILGNAQHHQLLALGEGGPGQAEYSSKQANFHGQQRK